MTNNTHPAFKKEAEPFYDIIMKGLAGAVDGAHFWDAVAEDAVFEFMYRFPGFPEKIEGRAQYMDWFGGYSMKLTSADGLAIHLCADPSVVVLEYSVHGATPAGKPYDNRFCSIITLRDRKIVHWRDYMDSLAVTRAL
ncbi:MAG TPA: nuclear transport factor 2 family protein [Dinghuibacter sp.]|jgi:ketosteroid isomerase-like protein|uniref:nuclear transport factor 2 family protein n=1 Tax=Dinghuibacter sp. TaxID=2024697 RepID=UPI002C955EF5|nr:nuclear transport factor 2 family protein [Dinghuibacter sp.]HTJ11157.1 nuclear transport factor 2 family protein [Dinghuibacter sp.]